MHYSAILLTLLTLFLIPCASIGQTAKAEAWALENKAADLYEAGLLKQADKIYQQVLAVYRNKPFLDQIGVGRVQFNRARLLIRLGQYDKAERALHGALVGHEEYYGKSHPKMAAVREEAGYLMRVRKSYAAAVDHYHAALLIREREMKQHAGVVLGQIEQSLKLFVKQRDLFSEYRLKRSMEIARLLVGKAPEDPPEQTALIPGRLADALNKGEGVRVFTAGLILQNIHSGELFREKIRYYANALYGLGVSNLELGKPITASKYLQRALICFELIDGLDKGFTPKAAKAMKRAYRDKGNSMEAAFLDVRQKYRSSEDKAALSAFDMKDAENSLRSMVQVMANNLGAKSKELEGPLIYLGLVLEHLGKLEEAKRVFARSKNLDK